MLTVSNMLQNTRTRLPHLADALEAIRKEPDMSPDKHYFTGGYVMRQTGMTKPVKDAAFETHREYIDVFYSRGGKRNSTLEPAGKYGGNRPL